MNENKTSLLKIFSVVFRDRSKTEPEHQLISSEMVKYFSRKELIEIISHIYDDDIPSEHNIAEMENEELLLLIRDDYSIISYITSKWSKEASKLPTQKEWIESRLFPKEEQKTEEETKNEVSEIPKQEAKIESKVVSKKTEKAKNT